MNNACCQNRMSLQADCGPNGFPKTCNGNFRRKKNITSTPPDIHNHGLLSFTIMHSSLQAIFRSRLTTTRLRYQATRVPSRPSPFQLRLAHSVLWKSCDSNWVSHIFLQPKDIRQNTRSWTLTTKVGLVLLVSRTMLRKYSEMSFSWSCQPLELKSSKEVSFFSLSLMSIHSYSVWLRISSDPIGAVESVKAASEIVRFT